MSDPSNPATQRSCATQPRLREEELRDFVEGASLGMQSIAADGIILWANAAQHAMLGYEPGELIGLNLAELHADREAARKLLERLRRGEEQRDLPVRLHAKDGQPKDVLLTASPVRQDGLTVRSRCFMFDATERRRAAETDALLAAIVTDSDDAILSKSIDGTIRSWNAAAERLFGHTAEEAIGNPITLIVPPELYEEERSFLERLRRGERIDHFETTRLAKNGKRISVSLTISPIHDSGRIVGASAVARDITERKEAERALQDSERRYRAIVESQAEMVCRFRPDGTILFANLAYARSVGRTNPDELVGANFWNFIAREEWPTVRALLESLTPEKPEVRIENRFRTTDGVRWTYWTNRALKFDSNGKLVEAQSTGVDITDRKRAEEALRDADRRKNEFLATLGHELRNPLAPIRNMLEVLERADDDPVLRRRAHDTMSRQLDVIVRLVDDLLDVARITRGRLQLRMQRVDLASAVQEAVEDVQYLIDEAHHELVVRLPDETIYLDADPVRLAQTFTNLLSNAAKYTPDGGRIELEAARRDGGVRVVVRDNGLGIPPTELETIFGMFEQVDHSIERGHKGLGIGLSLVKSLVDLHGGRIEARSEGLGLGSEFVVWLPAHPPAAEQTAVTADADAPGRASGRRRVLVVDDNRDAAESLAMLLGMLGHETSIAFDGEEALGAAERFRPDLVLLDIGLPKLDGHAVARELRKKPWGARAVIVAVTGWGQESDREASRAAGCDWHVTKPLTLERIEDALRAVSAG